MISQIQALDEAILIWIQEYIRVEWLNPVVECFTVLGNAGILWIVISAVLLCVKSTRKLGLASALALIFSLLITNLGIKPLMARPRPYVTMDELTALVRSSDPNSFPSGHTSAAFSAGIAWFSVTHRKSIQAVCLIQAVVMGLSRLYVGVHYPTDVLCGAVIGVCCGLLAGEILKHSRKHI